MDNEAPGFSCGPTYSYYKLEYGFRLTWNVGLLLANISTSPHPLEVENMYIACRNTEKWTRKIPSCLGIADL